MLFLDTATTNPPPRTAWAIPELSYGILLHPFFPVRYSRSAQFRSIQPQGLKKAFWSAGMQVLLVPLPPFSRP